MNRGLHIEISQNIHSNASKKEIKSAVKRFLRELKALIPGTRYSRNDYSSNEILSEHVKSIYLCNTNVDGVIQTENVEFIYHIYTLSTFSELTENIDNGNGESDIPAANIWPLPCEEFDGLWQTLIYDSNIKNDTLNFIATSLLFSDMNVDQNIIHWNKVILFHGPPGTGKTSLCKALGQKLSIRFCEQYPRAQLVEINSHSLFSKWFSESGKLVLKLFSKVKELLEDSNMLVFILIDEVESLTHARHSAMNGLEPSDSVRVVNAILTQIDQIKKYPNVLIMTTSNISQMIDLAFVDRADLKQYIGLPSIGATYEMYLSCINELIRVGILTHNGSPLFSYRFLTGCCFTKNDTTELSLKLLEIAKLSQGISGRSLRKIPFLTHALYIKTPTTNLEFFFVVMEKMVLRQIEDNKKLSNGIQ